MHHIKIDTADAFVEVDITGFWTVEDVAQFGHDLLAATSKLLVGGRSFVTFYDYSHAIIQSQQVVAAFQALALSTPARSRRAALFTEGGQARLQARRIAAVRPNDMVVFDERAAAFAWLRGEQILRTLNDSRAISALGSSRAG